MSTSWWQRTGVTRIMSGQRGAGRYRTALSRCGLPLDLPGVVAETEDANGRAQPYSAPIVWEYRALFGRREILDEKYDESGLYRGRGDHWRRASGFKREELDAYTPERRT